NRTAARKVAAAGTGTFMRTWATVWTTLVGYLLEGAATTLQRGCLAGEGLPPPDRNVDIERVKLDAEAHPASGFRGDQGRAAAQERLIDIRPRLGVVEHGPPHALDRLLG